MPSLDIPKRSEDITPEWLTGALTSTGVLAGGRVTEIRRELLGEDEGFMGEVNRLHLELAPAEAVGPKTVITKQPIATRAHRAQGELLGLYEREILFYRELAGELPVRTPRHYFSVMDPDPTSPESRERIERFVDTAPAWLLSLSLGFSTWLSGFSGRRYLLLLEDLSPAQMGDQINACSLDRLATCLDALATMQASQWNEPRLDALEWVPKLNSAGRVVRAMYLRARAQFEAKFPQRLVGEIRGLADWLDEGVLELAARVCESPYTLIHGDFRLDNLFFSAADPESEPIFTDWQVAAQGPGVYDVAYFLTSSLSADVDRDTELELLRGYHQRLRASGVSDYGFDRCRLDYQRCVLWMLSREIIALVSIEHANERGLEMVDLWIDRLFARLRGLDPVALMSSCP
jgi:thiamine kinase-like enzyme